MTDHPTDLDQTPAYNLPMPTPSLEDPVAVADMMDSALISEHDEDVWTPRGTRYPVPADASAVVVAHIPGSAAPGENAYLIIEPDGSTYVPTTGGRCGCGENEDYTPAMGTPVETAQQERAAAYCPHMKVAIQARSLHSNVNTPCPECGSWQVETSEVTRSHTMPSGDTYEQHMGTEAACAECGHVYQWL
jgi:hypothetical protein